MPRSPAAALPGAALRRRAVLAVGVALMAGALAACSDSADSSAAPGLTATQVPRPNDAVTNGMDDLSADEVLDQARTALLEADTFRVGGAPTEGSPLNLALVAGTATDGDDDDAEVVGRGARGTVSRDGATFRLRAVDGDVYVRGNLDWLADEIAASAERTLGETWLLLPESAAQDLATFTDPAQFVEAVLPVAPVEAVGVSVIGGLPAVGVRYLDNDATLWVSGVDEPYPVLLERLGATASGGVLRFSDINEPVELEPPRANNVIVAPDRSTG